MIDTNQTLETIVLLNLLNDECKCEAIHYDNDQYECTVLAVAKISYSCSSRSPLVCQSIVTEYWEGCEVGDWCDGCGDLISNCWSIRPV